MKKKAICTIMILILIITPCHRAYADAGTLTVAGGTIGIGGLSAGALAGLAGPAVVAVFCGMLAVGMDIELTQESQQAGMTKTEFIKSKINQYCNEANITANVFYKNIADNMSVTKAGAIELGDSASLQLKQFINWLFDTDQVMESNSGSNVGTVNLGGLNAPLLSQGETIYLRGSEGTPSNNVNLYVNSIQSEGEIAVIAVASDQNAVNNGRYYYWLVSNKTGTLYGTLTANGYVVSNNSAYNFGSTSVNGYYRTMIGNRTGVDINSDIPVYIGYSTGIDNLLRSFSGEWDSNMSNTGTSDTFTGDRDDWNERSGVLDPAQGFPTTINPGLIGQIPIPADTDITTNVREYLDALQRVLDGIQDRVIQGIDQEDGLPYEYDIPDTVAIDPTIGKIPPPQDSERTPVTDDSPPDPSSNPSMSMDPLKFDLKTIFPFCIPFDIKDMIGLLEADPVAPTYTVNWNIPIVNVPLNFTIDLSPWNSVAVICRRMELLLFIIGLAMVTRNLIRG